VAESDELRERVEQPVESPKSGARMDALVAERDGRLGHTPHRLAISHIFVRTGAHDLKTNNTANFSSANDNKRSGGNDHTRRQVDRDRSRIPSRRVPETNFERVVLVLGLCAIGVLGFLVVREKHHGVRSSLTPTIVSRPTATATSAATFETPTQPATQTEAGQLAQLVLTATRGDCWVVVRTRSARGKVIFAGVISRGTKKRFSGPRLWLRLGAAGNLSGRLNGARLALPPGTPTILATATGIRVLALR
jgi:hypothetical protein